jgi:hypothetical protein
MRMRIALVILPLTLVACGKSETDPRLALCLSATRQTATSPASVRMTDFEATPKDVKQAATVNSKAVMDADAANSYGGKRRISATCEFAPHPLPERKGSVLLTAATIGTIRLNDQQLADANALDGSARSVTDAMTAAEMLRAGKTDGDAK